MDGGFEFGLYRTGYTMLLTAVGPRFLDSLNSCKLLTCETLGNHRNK